MDISHTTLAELTAFLVAMSGLLTVFGAALGSWITTQRMAKRSELDSLRSRVDDLTTENIRLHNKIAELIDENTVLRRILREHGIDVPTPIVAPVLQEA